MMKTSQSQRGQILIIVAVGLVVLLGIAALVIDIGFSWMLRRQEQNAADPAAIAAARWLKDPVTGDAVDPATVQTQMDADGCFYAQQNGFFVSDINCAAALASDDLRVLSPPVSGPYSGQPGHVQVIIHATHPTFFGRIFGRTESGVTTAGVAANTAGNSNSASLVSLKPDCSGGAAGQVSGGGTVRIFPAAGVTAPGGNVHVNSTCGASMDDVCTSGVGGSALHISGRLETPFASVVGSCTVQGSDPADGLHCTGASPCLNEGATPLGDPLAFLPEPSLTGFPDGRCPNGTLSTSASTTACELSGNGGSPPCPPDPVTGDTVCHLTPGVYYGGWDVKSNVEVILDPGMYILAGGGIKLSGSSSIEGVDDGTGSASRVTIFSTDGPGCPGITVQCQGAITFTANQAFRVRATPGSDPTIFSPTCANVMPGYNLCPWAGILLWQDGTASNPDAAIKLGGTSATVLSGTIYAPKADVLINGGSGTTGCSGPIATQSCLSVQVISWTWKIDGNALVEMPYDPEQIYQQDHRGLVY